MTRRALLASASVSLFAASKPLDSAEQLLERAVADGKLRAAVLRVDTGSKTYEKAFGAARVDTPFLIASITKPMTVAAVMTLVDEGKLKLDGSASRYLPGLDPRITLRHLMSHSSGLPDMLPENDDLRKQHVPLNEFVKRSLTTPLLFPPGTKVKYQSMGILLASHIAEKVAGQPFPKFVEQRIFRPLDMNHTVLGLGRYKIADTAQSQVEFADPKGGNDWDWNSAYWRNLGAPWGGAHSTAGDISRFLRYFLHPVAGKPLSLASAKAMITDQNAGRNQPYALGWSLKTKSFGHGGSTGTLSWADANTDTTFVLLTTLPARVSQSTILDPVSKLVTSGLA